MDLAEADSKHDCGQIWEEDWKQWEGKWRKLEVREDYQQTRL